jgi:hypothetical protein
LEVLLCGTLVGVIEAVIASGFAEILGEPQVGQLIALEEQMDRAKGQAPGSDIVRRPTQT